MALTPSNPGPSTKATYHTGTDYEAQLIALLPPGIALLAPPGSVLRAVIGAIADALSFADLRQGQLMLESDPRTCRELLTEWESMLGLPDPCATGAKTFDQRRTAVAAKYVAIGGQSAAYYIGIAASLGYPGATVQEYVPATCNSDCNSQLWSEADRFTWQLSLPGSAGITYATCNSDCNAQLQSWGDDIVECRIRKAAPAHTTPVFAYP